MANLVLRPFFGRRQQQCRIKRQRHADRRPSSRSKVNRSRVIFTATMSGGGVLFCFIPRLEQFCFVLPQNAKDFAQIGFAKALVPTQLHRSQPKLRLASRLLPMHVGRLIRFRAVEPDSTASLPQDGWHSNSLYDLGEHGKSRTGSQFLSNC